MDKTVQQTLLERRSIRRYEYEAVSDSDMNFIYEAIRNTPTSYNGQQYSVVDVFDPELKLKLYEVTGQKQIKTCSHFMLFVADFHKIAVAAECKGIELSDFVHTADGYTVAVIDASLAMMSAVTAAVSRGLGTCPVGYIRTADPDKVAELLTLPKGVFPVCGLAIGVPRELPDIKPKQPLDLLIHRNQYRTDDMTDDLMAYDAAICSYNATRSGTTSTNDWTAHIMSYYREGESYDTLAAARRQSFLVADK